MEQNLPLQIEDTEITSSWMKIDAAAMAVRSGVEFHPASNGNWNIPGADPIDMLPGEVWMSIDSLQPDAARSARAVLGRYASCNISYMKPHPS